MKNSYLKKYTLEQRVAMLEEEIAELKRQVGNTQTEHKLFSEKWTARITQLLMKRWKKSN